MALYDANEMPRAVVTPPLAASRYRGRARPNWGALASIFALHVAAIWGLSAAGVIEVRRLPPELKMIELSSEVAPPPRIVAEPERVLAESSKLSIETATVAPPVQASARIAAAPSVRPVAAVVAPEVIAAPMPPPAPEGPVRVTDLDAKAITVVHPKYPIESRRRREQGTVVLAVTLAADGSVETVSVARSSGFDRLDKAALDAVRRWRWSPTLRDGAPVSVRGTVDIPFVLQG
jgi:periplasmic protein TonB